MGMGMGITLRSSKYVGYWMIIQLALEVILEAWMNDRIQLKDVGCSGTERWLQRMTERVHIPRP